MGENLVFIPHQILIFYVEISEELCDFELYTCLIKLRAEIWTNVKTHFWKGWVAVGAFYKV